MTLLQQCHQFMDELNLYLQSLIQEACSYPSASPERRKALNSIFRCVLKSGRTWRGVGDCYEEALSTTLFNLSQTLCEKYNPDRGLFLSWFNTCLRNQYRDEIRGTQRDRSHIQPVWQNNENEERNPLDQVATPIDATLLFNTWESFIQWIEDDPDGILRACHIKGNPKANFQALAYLKIFIGKEWEEIAAEVGSPSRTLRSHWSRHYKTFVREWLEKNQRLFGEESYDQ